jgi:hypothetical protein
MKINKFTDWLSSRQILESSDDDGNIEFFEKRKAGARKISTEAKAKGGPALLTHWHFFAKDKQYAEVIKSIKNKKNKEFFQSKYKSFMSKLHSKLDQKEFQTISGQLEVWGEVLHKVFQT